MNLNTREKIYSCQKSLCTTFCQRGQFPYSPGILYSEQGATDQ